VAAVVVLAAALPTAAAPPARAAAAPPAGASSYVAVTPARLADTRAEGGATGFTRVGPTHIRVQVTGRAGIQPGATSAVLNIASVGAVAAGFVTAFPSGSPLPLASSLNVDVPGRIVANLATVRLGPDGAVDLYTNVAMDLVVDVQGAYRAAPGEVRAGRLVTFPGGARRATDTRTAGVPLGPGGTQHVGVGQVGVPADATAVVVNLAATETAAAGYWTAYPAGIPRPFTSSLNIDAPAQTRNAQAIVRLEPGPRAIEVFSQSGGHLVVDVVGYYTGETSPPSTDGLFVPTNPFRVLDTRATYAIAPWGGTTIEFPTYAPVAAAAVAMNIAIAEPLDIGFVTAFPAGVPRPLAANLNVMAFEQIISNHATVRLGTRGVSLYTQSGTQMIVDVTGWYLGAPDASGAVAPNPTFGPTWATQIYAPGVVNAGVGYGADIDTVVDRGLAGLYAGEGGLGVPEHNIFFAHRTSAGGVFRHLDRLRVGSVFVVVGADGHQYRYLVTQTAVIEPWPKVLLDLVVRSGPVTATLVACHPPGSTRYRIVVSGRLIGAA